MNEKKIIVLQQAPWIKYIEIDEKTGERKLKKDTPNEIVRAYEEHLKQKSNDKNVAK